ncbi:hypothetical protein [Pseudomonas sp. 06C 126]|uniref:hypothetical protein n=1 Tax=Pseudomonas sp. 06C 126 TaxID=1917281 RepID=UPI0008DB0D51|nr:hypothetical protein [Pseudomonas sp. 06C 126]OHW39789.1 hypothetical protein BHC62_18785 [Pseudomonas sp. 06C 126]
MSNSPHIPPYATIIADALTTDLLRHHWDRSLFGITQSIDPQSIAYHVAIAKGFALGLLAGKLIDKKVDEAMGVAISVAQGEAWRRGGHLPHQSPGLT